MAKSKTMRAVVKVPGQPAEVKEWADSYENLRAAVGGCITIAVSVERKLPYCPAGTVYCHDEGLLECQPWNRYLHGHYLAGNLVVLGPPDGEGNDKPLTEEAAKEWCSILDAMILRDPQGKVFSGMLPTIPSSIEGLEEITGRPAMTFTPIGEDLKPSGPTVSLTGRPVPRGG